ncbi:thioredoxin [Chryseobacterium sp. SIMBA_038]|uniref:thioredoxin n=1 Tax=Chryseobacterium sp. SIMBA_038 TaxID=3085780 RepID=UPI0039785F61
MALEITDSSFAEILSKSKEQPVLVDFWAVWCGPCRTLGPIIEEVATDFDGKAIVGKVDVDNNQEISMQYGIRNIPTVLIFRNGEVVDKIVGVAPKETIAEKLSAHL